MNISIKTFDELTAQELYTILQLRSEVFVVEQNCIYQDVDDKDQKAIHVFAEKDNRAIAYTRVFKPGDYFENTAIGRVVVKASERKYGYGKIIMRATLDYIDQILKDTKIELSAQVYLIKFYNGLGFIEEGAEYLEDDIPHIKMVKP